jgi:hypothetical protein
LLFPSAHSLISPRLCLSNHYHLLGESLPSTQDEHPEVNDTHQVGLSVPEEYPVVNDTLQIEFPLPSHVSIVHDATPRRTIRAWLSVAPKNAVVEEKKDDIPSIADAFIEENSEVAPPINEDSKLITKIKRKEEPSQQVPQYIPDTHSTEKYPTEHIAHDSISPEAPSYKRELDVESVDIHQSAPSPQISPIFESENLTQVIIYNNLPSIKSDSELNTIQNEFHEISSDDENVNYGNLNVVPQVSLVCLSFRYDILFVVTLNNLQRSPIKNEEAVSSNKSAAKKRKRDKVEDLVGGENKKVKSNLNNKYDNHLRDFLLSLL